MWGSKLVSGLDSFLHRLALVSVRQQTWCLLCGLCFFLDLWKANLCSSNGIKKRGVNLMWTTRNSNCLILHRCWITSEKIHPCTSKSVLYGGWDKRLALLFYSHAEEWNVLPVFCSSVNLMADLWHSSVCCVMCYQSTGYPEGHFHSIGTVGKKKVDPDYKMNWFLLNRFFWIWEMGRNAPTRDEVWGHDWGGRSDG